MPLARKVNLYKIKGVRRRSTRQSGYTARESLLTLDPIFSGLGRKARPVAQPDSSQPSVFARR